MNSFHRIIAHRKRLTLTVLLLTLVTHQCSFVTTAHKILDDDVGWRIISWTMLKWLNARQHRPGQLDITHHCSWTVLTMAAGLKTSEWRSTSINYSIWQFWLHTEIGNILAMEYSSVLIGISRITSTRLCPELTTENSGLQMTRKLTSCWAMNESLSITRGSAPFPDNFSGLTGKTQTQFLTLIWISWIS